MHAHRGTAEPFSFVGSQKYPIFRTDREIILAPNNRLYLDSFEHVVCKSSVYSVYRLKKTDCNCPVKLKSLLWGSSGFEMSKCYRRF